MKLGSLFSGLGGLELGLERSIPNLHTVWQVEKESFCRQVLEQHWPHAKRYDDVRTVGAHNLEPVDILCGGFPCQSISVAGKQEGLANEEKSGLWWEMHRIISELRPRIAILENVANVLSVGGPDVVGSLARIGYDCEWTIIRASDFGAPHHRARWFCVAYPVRTGTRQQSQLSECMEKIQKIQHGANVGNTTMRNERDNTRPRRWKQSNCEPLLCGMVNGVPTGLDKTTRSENNRRLKALGNAVVPQCAEWVGQQIVNSGLLEVACSQNN